MDACPGRLNQIALFIPQPGIYYGNCSEICGSRHGYMPICVEAVSFEDYCVEGEAPQGAHASQRSCGDAPAKMCEKPHKKRSLGSDGRNREAASCLVDSMGSPKVPCQRGRN